MLDKIDPVSALIAVGVSVVGIYWAYNSFFSSAPSVGLNEQNYQKYKLVKKENISHNTRLFRFALQTPKTKLGLPIGKHMSLRFFNNEEVRRPYTPISSDDELGYFDLMIKIYPQGQMSQHLDHLSLGDSIEARGPLGRIHYDKIGHFKILKRKDEYDELNVTKINMIAGGTGITPMMQIIRHVIKDVNDPTTISLIFANVSYDDILLKNELEDLHKNHSNKFELFFTLDKKPLNENWNQGVGFVTAEMIKTHLYPPNDDVVVLNCGPPIMVKMLNKYEEELGYNKTNVLNF